jgi:hypothetical protein
MILPVPGGHVERVGGGQLEVDGGGVEVDGEGVEEGRLGVLPELQHSWQDGVASPLLLQVVQAAAAAAVGGRRVGNIVGGRATHTRLQIKTK